MAWEAGKRVGCDEVAQQLQEAQQQALCPSWSEMVLQLAWWALWGAPGKGALQESEEASLGVQASQGAAQRQQRRAESTARA
jgi:hypothetical protein